MVENQHIYRTIFILVPTSSFRMLFFKNEARESASSLQIQSNRGCTEKWIKFFTLIAHIGETII
jgi:hypothetical protein